MSRKYEIRRRRDARPITTLDREVREQLDEREDWEIAWEGHGIKFPIVIPMLDGPECESSILGYYE